jgi:hypothetical protein
MGIMSRIFKLGGQIANDPIASADPSGFSPQNQGSWKGYRSVPVVKTARTYTDKDVEMLEKMKAEIALRVKSTQKAFDLLQQIEALDVQLTESYHGYKVGSATMSLAKAKSASTASAKLTALEPQYHKLGEGLKVARLRSQEMMKSLRDVQ